MNKMNCELCEKNRAQMYCESDEANLCWDCDFKVHSANFLVAKHSRNLLCHSCQSPTPWAASGPKLNPTLSICTSCLDNPASAAAVKLPNPNYGERVEENYQTETETETDDEDDDSEIDEDSDDDDGNQVVPSPSPSLSRSVSCSSGSYGDLSAATGDGGVMVDVSSPLKRARESDCSEDEETYSSSLNCHSLSKENKETSSSSIGFLRPMKMFRTNELCE